MKNSTLVLARLAILLALTLMVEMIGLPQPVTGPLINMFLFLTVLLLNIKSAVLLGCVTPLVALWRGQLPPLLAPMIPFIIGGNTLLVITFGLSRRQWYRWFNFKIFLVQILGETLPVVLSAFLKFLFLYSAARFLIPLIFGKQLPEKLLVMMALPQFLSALFGGIFAIILVKFFMRIQEVR